MLPPNLARALAKGTVMSCFLFYFLFPDLCFVFYLRYVFFYLDDFIHFVVLFSNVTHRVGSTKVTVCILGFVLFCFVFLVLDSILFLDKWHIIIVMSYPYLCPKIVFRFILV